MPSSETQFADRLIGERIGVAFVRCHDDALLASDLKVGCPEEVAYSIGFIDTSQLPALAEPIMKTQHGEYLRRLIR